MALLGATLSVSAQNQPIYITGDTRGNDVLVDLTLRDADISEVLVALFNTTNGKYEAEISPDVSGRIPMLTLRQQPFDKALSAVLGSKYSFTTKPLGNGIVRYVISSGNTTSGGSSGYANVNRPTDPSMGGGNSSTPAGFDGNSSGTANRKPSIPTKPATHREMRASSESSIVKMIGVSYLDLNSLIQALGGTVLELYSVDNSLGSSGVSNNNNNNSNNNNRNNNNNNIRNNF